MVSTFPACSIDKVLVAVSNLHKFILACSLGDEADGFDETLIPVDFKTAGQIVDDDVFKILVKPMKRDVRVTVLVSKSVMA
jgi:hypothetical protein